MSVFVRAGTHRDDISSEMSVQRMKERLGDNRAGLGLSGAGVRRTEIPISSYQHRAKIDKSDR